MGVMSTDDGGVGEGGFRTVEGTAGNSLSSNNLQVVPTCDCVLLGGVDKSRRGNGDTGIDEPQRGVRGVEILRGDARGDGLGRGVCSWDANLHGGTWGELRFAATAGEIRAVSLRGVNPGEVKAVSGRTMDIGEILFWGNGEG